MFKSLTIGDGARAPVPAPEVWGWGWKFQPSENVIGSTGSPTFKCFPLTHLVNLTGDTFTTFLTGNSKGFRSSVPGTECVSLLINHNTALLTCERWKQDASLSMRLAKAIRELADMVYQLALTGSKTIPPKPNGLKHHSVRDSQC